MEGFDSKTVKFSFYIIYINRRSSKTQKHKNTKTQKHMEVSEPAQKKRKKELGQYFTIDNKLKKIVRTFIRNTPARILEPSVGRGDLVKYLQDDGLCIQYDMYEIDNTIEFIIPEDGIHFGDFLKTNIDQTYKTIIGNPPYIKGSGGNVYIEFIRKCITLLEEHGELIFIIPSDFFKLTSAAPLLCEMCKEGSFTDIFHPHNENLFNDASIDVVVFRYEKGCKDNNKISYNGLPRWVYNNDGILYFSTIELKSPVVFKDIFSIHVGMVTGKKKVFQHDTLGSIDVLYDDKKRKKFIWLNTFPSGNEQIDTYMLHHKNILLQRKILSFNEKNWFKWGAPRNKSIIEQNKGKKCIYVRNLTRNKKIAFIGEVEYFGGSLMMLLPQKKINLDNVVQYMNSEHFIDMFLYSGRYKIGHRILCNAIIDREII